jgi:hypothetical protein
MRRKDWLLAVSYWLLASELTPQPPSRKPILKVDSAIEGGVRRGRIGFEAWWLPKLKVDHLSTLSFIKERARVSLFIG